MCSAPTLTFSPSIFPGDELKTGRAVQTLCTCVAPQSLPNTGTTMSEHVIEEGAFLLASQLSNAVKRGHDFTLGL